MAKSFKEMLVESGQELEFQSGGKAPDHLVDREIKWEPHPRTMNFLTGTPGSIFRATMKYRLSDGQKH